MKTKSQQDKMQIELRRLFTKTVKELDSRDWSNSFKVNMTANEILGVDFQRFFVQETEASKKFTQAFWVRDPRKFQEWAAKALVQASPLSDEDIEKLMLRKQLYSKLASFRGFVLKDVVLKKLEELHRDRKVGSTSFRRLKDLLVAMALDSQKELSTYVSGLNEILDAEILELWNTDKQRLADLFKDYGIPDIRLSVVIDHLRFPEQAGVIGKRLKESVFTIVEELGPLGLELNPDSLISAHKRLKREERRKKTH